MPIVTTHPNTEVDVAIDQVDIGTLENTPSQQKLTTLIDNLSAPCEVKGSFSPLIDIENEKDGRITELMRVYYKHLDSLLSEKMIDKVTYGAAAIKLLSEATAISTSTYQFDKSLCQDNAKVVASLAQTKVDLINSEIRKFITAYEAQDLNYKIAVFNPLAREAMKEDNLNKHVEHELKNYDLRNMKPEELSVLKEQVKTSVADRLIKEYYQSTVQPKELEKLDAETDTLRFDVDRMKPQELLVLQEQVKMSIADRLSKEYYQSTVQPKELEKLDAETDTLRFDVGNMKPEELLVLQEQVKMSRADRLSKEYYQTTVQPKELDKLDAETDTLRFDVDSRKPEELLVLKEQVKMSVADRIAKEYYQTTVQPKELEKLDAEADTLRFNVDRMKPQELLVLQEQVRMSRADRVAKEYYQAHIQPCEKDLTCAKARIERINAGLVGSTALPTLKHAQIAKQTELYDAEISNYQDRKHQELLKTMINYHSMIFPDLPAPTAIGWAVNEANSQALYTNLL